MSLCLTDRFEKWQEEFNVQVIFFRFFFALMKVCGGHVAFQ
jgi:hypothetical protein